jgi:hypothetical protein
MPPRALIISIEEYQRSDVLARSLPGTDEGAAGFRGWLLGRKGLEPGAVRCCARDGFAGRTSGTARRDIIDELAGLVGRGRNDTPELYFYFSGHGFSYPVPRGGPVDVLVAADFADLANSGDACLQLQEIQEKLWAALGPGEHYYFIDACRNPVSDHDIEVLSLGRVFPPSDLGKPSRYTLFSTAPGQAAAVQSGFPRVLVDGLGGRGRAKAWRGPEMYVTFERLCEYVRGRVTRQELESMSRGDGKGLILRLDPIPQSSCHITIEGATPDDEYVPRFRDVRDLARTFPPFRGGTYEVTMPPEDYFVEISHGGADVVRVEPPGDGPLDLYDACAVRFRESLEEMAVAPAERQAHVTLTAAPHTEIALTRAQTGEVHDAVGRLEQTLPTGVYDVEVREDGLVVHRDRLTLRPGERLELDLLARGPSEVRRSILEAVSGDAAARLARFDTISPLANWDLPLWLALLGASRVVAPPTLFQQLGRLALESFDDVRAGETAFYVLTALEHISATAKCDAGLGRDTTVRWEPLRPVEKLYKVCHCRLTAEPGWRLLSLHAPGQAQVTFASVALPNRVTLVTLVQDPQGRMSAHQYLLRLHHLTHALPPRVLDNLDLTSLNLVRTMYAVQQRFGEQKSLMAGAGPGGQEWLMVAYQEWLDPVLSLLVAYDLIRQGKVSREKALLHEMVGNLRTYFGEIPDVEAVAKLAGLPAAAPQAPPLLLDGVLAFEEGPGPNLFPLPANRLDYGSPWTSWRGAVVK